MRQANKLGTYSISGKGIIFKSDCSCNGDTSDDR